MFFFMRRHVSTFGIALGVGRQVWKQRSLGGPGESSHFEAFEKFVFFWKRMLQTRSNKIWLKTVLVFLLSTNGYGLTHYAQKPKA